MNKAQLMKHCGYNISSIDTTKPALIKKKMKKKVKNNCTPFNQNEMSVQIPIDSGWYLSPQPIPKPMLRVPVKGKQSSNIQTTYNKVSQINKEKNHDLPDYANYLIQDKLVYGGEPHDNVQYNKLLLYGVTAIIDLVKEKNTKKKFNYREHVPTYITYSHYPIKGGSTLIDSKMKTIVNSIVDMINNGEIVYIHCMGGHGRSGVVAGIVYSYLTKSNYKDTLLYMKKMHNTRKYKPSKSTPLEAVQFGQMLRLIENKNDIYFYDEKDPIYGFLSNFYKAPITIDNVTWPTTEHYFQASKFPSNTPMGREYREIIRKANTGNKSALLGRQELKGQWSFKYTLNLQDKRTLKDIIETYKTVKMRTDWDTVKNDVMKQALVSKFTQNPQLKIKLLNTGDAPLHEYTNRDSYWALPGSDNLGKLLMEVRESLKTR